MTTLDIDLIDVIHGGSAVGRAEDGRVVLARFGLPSGRVWIQVTGQHLTLIRGDVMGVLSSPSEHRIDLMWLKAGPLGVSGADLGHVALSYQVEWKSYVLTTALGRTDGRDLQERFAEQDLSPRVATLPGDTETSGWATRARIEFVVDEDDQPAIYRDSGRKLMGVASFPLAIEEIGEPDLFGGWRSWRKPGERARALAPSGSNPALFVDEDT